MGIDRDMKVPIRWFIWLLAACLTTVFLAGAWANSVNSFVSAGAAKLSNHDIVLQDINNRLLRIEIVTGADKIPLPKGRGQ